MAQKNRNPHSNIKRGIGLFHCAECGKLTRGPHDVHGTDLCGFCFEGFEWVNSVLDGCSIEDVPEKFQEFVKARV